MKNATKSANKHSSQDELIQLDSFVAGACREAAKDNPLLDDERGGRDAILPSIPPIHYGAQSFPSFTVSRA